MLKVSTDAPEPVVLDASKEEPPFRPIPHFSITCRPIETPMILAARTAAAAAQRTMAEELGLVMPRDLEAAARILLEHPEVQAAGNFAFTRYLAIAGITAWEGVCGPDDKPLAPTLKAIDAALRKQAVFDFIDRRYVGPALALDDEKNASSPSRNTTSRRAKRIAKGAAKPAGEAAPTARTS